MTKPSDAALPSVVTRPPVPWWLFPGALLLYFLRLGYDYGVSDQDEVLPYLLHRLDPSLFTQDWYVMAQAGAFNVRSYFVTVLQSVALVFPVPWALALVYVGVWLALAGGVYEIARQLVVDRLAAAAAVVLVLVMTPLWTLGGNELAASVLVPSMAAWALALWGFVLFLRKQMLLAGLLLGLAVWMQALVGLLVAGLLGAALLLRTRRRADLGPVLRFGGAFVLSALPALGPLLYQQFAPPAATLPHEGPSLFYIMAKFRNPHHYLFLSFPARSVVRFGLVAVLGGVSFVLLRQRGRLREARLLGHLFALIVALCLVGFVFTELWPTLFVAKLQLFKSTVFAKLLLLILLCGAVVAWLPPRLTAWLHRLMDRTGWMTGAAVAAWLVVLGAIALEIEPFYSRARFLAHDATPVAAVEAWARAETPREAVFAVPPSWSRFRSGARRAIVGNFKAFVYRDDLVVQWMERLTALAPMPLPARATPALQQQLDAAYEAQPPAALLGLAERYGIDFVVRTEAVDHPAFVEVFAAGPWHVYRIDLPARPLV